MHADSHGAGHTSLAPLLDVRIKSGQLLVVHDST